MFAGQFGRRQKLTPETLRRLGRVPPPVPSEEPSATLAFDPDSDDNSGVGLLGPADLLPGQAGKVPCTRARTRTHTHTQRERERERERAC